MENNKLMDFLNEVSKLAKEKGLVISSFKYNESRFEEGSLKAPELEIKTTIN